MVVGCWSLVAQDVPPPTANPPPTTDNLQGILLTLITQHPWLATVLLAIGGLRLVLKPIMLAIEWYTKQTPNPDDDVAVLKFEASPLYKVLSIGLDLFGSIKVPLVKPPKKP